MSTLESIGIFNLIVVIVIAVIIILILWFLYLSIKRLRKAHIEPAHYPHYYLCRDGHKVRSLSELVVDNELTALGIEHEYEHLIDKKSERKFKYDWYLPGTQTYIEFFGLHTRRYLKNRKEKERFYKERDLHLVSLEPRDLINIREALVKKLGLSESYSRKKLFCPHCGYELDRRFQ